MAATANVQEATDAGPNWNTVTNVRFCSADEHDPGTSYPIAIPGAGTNYSYWKTLALQFTGSYTQVTNVEIYTDGTLGWGTDVDVYVGDETFAEANYEQATGTEGTTGDEMVANHSQLTGSTDFFTYTSGAKKTVDAGPVTGDGTRSDCLVLQTNVGTGASQGVKSTETITFVYDEV